jgi:hypothetical protein
MEGGENKVSLTSFRSLQQVKYKNRIPRHYHRAHKKHTQKHLTRFSQVKHKNPSP